MWWMSQRVEGGPEQQPKQGGSCSAWHAKPRWPLRGSSEGLAGWPFGAARKAGDRSAPGLQAIQQPPHTWGKQWGMPPLMGLDLSNTASGRMYSTAHQFQRAGQALSEPS